MMIFLKILYLFLQVSFGNDLSIGDDFYKKREKLSNVYSALKHYEKFYDKNPTSVDAMWRISMAHYYNIACTIHQFF